jgi:hypothetical protein
VVVVLPIVLVVVCAEVGVADEVPPPPPHPARMHADTPEIIRLFLYFNAFDFMLIPGLKRQLVLSENDRKFIV